MKRETVKDTHTANTTPGSGDIESTPALALRPREAAKAIGISERLLWTWTNQRFVPHLRVGKAVLYPVAELQRWLSSEAAKATRR